MHGPPFSKLLWEEENEVEQLISTLKVNTSSNDCKIILEDNNNEWNYNITDI